MKVDLEAIKERLTWAGDGPWEAIWKPDCLISPHVQHIDGSKRYTIATPAHSNDQTMKTMEFIAGARQDIPWLLKTNYTLTDEVAQLRQQIAELERLKGIRWRGPWKR